PRLFRPRREERPHLREIVGRAELELRRILRVEESPVLTQHVKMRVADNARVLAQKRLVLILWAEVDLDPDEVARDVALQVRVRRDEVVEDVTPRAPFAPDIENDAPVRGARQSDGGGKIDVRI